MTDGRPYRRNVLFLVWEILKIVLLATDDAQNCSLLVPIFGLDLGLAPTKCVNHTTLHGNVRTV